MKSFLAIGLLLLPAFAAYAAPPAAPAPIMAEMPKSEARGAFLDASGSSHLWRITPAHALEWDGQAYLPAGGAFTPHFWVDGQTEDNWTKDRIDLDKFAAGGIHDLALNAGSKGLTHVPPTAVQRVLDYLESHGFHYGLEIADFPRDPLVGYLIKPAVYRDPAPPADGPARFTHIAGLADAFYMLVSARDGSVDQSGSAQVVGGDTAQVTLQSPDPTDVLLLYPERLYFAGTPESHLPDLWQGYDEYRDRVLSFFRHIKLGPGFRFFLDPLTDQIGFRGEAENVIPVTDGFRMDFQVWLEHQYGHNIDNLNRAWGIQEADMPDFTTAARCVPLWFQAKGIPAVYDPVKKASYTVMNKPRIASHYWDDLRAFRIVSVRGYMNAMADALKKGVANVPVVYKWSGQSPLFSNDRTEGGFDGLAMTTGSGAGTFAQAEDAPGATWLIADSVGGYTSKAVLFDAWDTQGEVGARGFFSDSLAQMSAAPDQLNWLGAYGVALTRNGSGLSSEPLVLPYPAGVAGVNAAIRHLASGAWWLPSYRAADQFRAGDAFPLGPALRGYRLSLAQGLLPRFVVWSPRGVLREVHFPFPEAVIPIFADASGEPLKIQKKKGYWIVPIGSDPIVISHVGYLPLPLDAVEAADAEASALMKMAAEQHIQLSALQDRLFYARNSIPGTAATGDLRYNTLIPIINELTRILQPYSWFEGENAFRYTFDSLASDPDASSGAYLSLNTDRPPPAASALNEGGYRAEYRFAVNAPGTYALWMTGSQVDSLETSPFSYQIDKGGENDTSGSTVEGSAYAGKFVWNHLGDAELQRGTHTLSIIVTNPRPSDSRYVLALDAFCISRVPFHPDGVNQPTIDVMPPPDVTLPGKGGKK